MITVRRLSSFSIDAAMPVKPHKCGPYQFGTWTDFDKGEISECYYQKVKVDFLNATCQQNTVGQFVRIQLDKTNPLTLCEVEIFGRQLPSVYIGIRDELYFLHSFSLLMILFCIIFINFCVFV